MKTSYAAVGLVVLALGGLWLAGGGPQQPLAAADQLRVADPVTHDNLSVYFVYGPDTVDSSRVVTLQEALARGWAVVHETNEVNTLAVENRSPDHELFLQSGDIVKGGRQDRLIASDLLVPPGSGRVPVPAHCVEARRWTNRGTEAVTHFARSDNFVVGKALKLANADRNQTEVWNNVAAEQQKLSGNVGVTVNAAASPTSLQLALENSAVKAKVGDYETALKPAGVSRAGVVGAVFVVNGKVSGAEVYGSAGLFQKAWPKLIGAAAAEALADRPANGKIAPAPAAREMADFLVQAAQPQPASAAVPAPEPEFAARQIELRQLGGDVVEVTNRSAGGRVEPVQFQQLAATGAIDIPTPNAPTPNGRVANVNPSKPAADNVIVGNRTRPASRNMMGQALGQVAASPGNRANVNMIDNPTARYAETRDAARPSAVFHRTYIGK